MAENEIPPKPPEAQVTAAPSAYDEFGTAKRTLPPAAPVAIALVIVGIVVAIIAYTQRAKPAAQGTVDGEWMAASGRAAPESRPASFRNLDDCAVDFAERRRGDPGVGGGHKTKSQRGPTDYRLHDHACFSLGSSQIRTSPHEFGNRHGATLPSGARKAISQQLLPTAGKSG